MYQRIVVVNQVGQGGAESILETLVDVLHLLSGVVELPNGENLMDKNLLYSRQLFLPDLYF
jgi:hypothetical protein